MVPLALEPVLSWKIPHASPEWESGVGRNQSFARTQNSEKTRENASGSAAFTYPQTTRRVVQAEQQKAATRQGQCANGKVWASPLSRSIASPSDGCGPQNKSVNSWYRSSSRSDQPLDSPQLEGLSQGSGNVHDRHHHEKVKNSAQPSGTSASSPENSISLVREVRVESQRQRQLDGQGTVKSTKSLQHSHSYLQVPPGQARTSVQQSAPRLMPPADGSQSHAAHNTSQYLKEWERTNRTELVKNSESKDESGLERGATMAQRQRVCERIQSASEPVSQSRQSASLMGHHHLQSQLRPVAATGQSILTPKYWQQSQSGPITPQSQSTSVTPQSQSRSAGLQSQPKTVTPQSQFRTITPQSQSSSATPHSQSRTITPHSQSKSVTLQSQSRNVTPQSQSRSATLQSQSRSATVQSQSRSATLQSQSRNVTPQSQSRSATLQSQSRSATLQSQSRNVTPRGQSASSAGHQQQSQSGLVAANTEPVVPAGYRGESASRLQVRDASTRSPAHWRHAQNTGYSNATSEDLQRQLKSAQNFEDQGHRSRSPPSIQGHGSYRSMSRLQKYYSLQYQDGFSRWVCICVGETPI